MNLKELVIVIKEKNLSKDQLEAYHSDMVYVYSDMQSELADIRKAKAVYFMENKEYQAIEGREIKRGIGMASGYEQVAVTKERSDVSTERMWQVTEKGQREIEISHWLKAIEKLLQSLKTRLYSVY